MSKDNPMVTLSHLYKSEGLKHLQSRILCFFVMCHCNIIIQCTPTKCTFFFSKHVHVEGIVKIKIKVYYKKGVFCWCTFYDLQSH
jgi:hypothetical protein